MKTYISMLSHCFNENDGLRIIEIYEEYITRNKGKNISINKFKVYLKDNYGISLSLNAIRNHISYYSDDKEKDKIMDKVKIQDVVKFVFTLFPFNLNDQQWESREFCNFVREFKMEYRNELGSPLPNKVSDKRIMNVFHEISDKYYLNLQYQDDQDTVDNIKIIWNLVEPKQYKTDGMLYICDGGEYMYRNDYILNRYKLEKNKPIVKRKIKIEAPILKDENLDNKFSYIDYITLEELVSKTVRYIKNYMEGFSKPVENIIVANRWAINILNALCSEQDKQDKDMINYKLATENDIKRMLK